MSDGGSAHIEGERPNISETRSGFLPRQVKEWGGRLRRYISRPGRDSSADSTQLATPVEVIVSVGDQPSDKEENNTPHELPAVDKLIGPRVNIVPTARRYKAEGVDTERVDPLDGEYEFQSAEALETWYKMKPELYALTAVMIDRIVGRALQAKIAGKYPPFGLIVFDSGAINPNNAPTPVSSLSGFTDSMHLKDAMKATLTRAKHEEVESLEQSEHEQDENSRAGSVYKRLKKLIEFKRKYIKQGYSSETTQEALESFIQAGIGTAAHVMSEVIYMVPQLYQAEGLELDPVEMVRTAENSFQPVAELAMKHLYDFGGVSDNIEKGEFYKRFKPESFVLVDTPNGKRLHIVDDAQKYDPAKIAQLHQFNFNGPATVGCPAMVNFGDGSPARKLWEWHVELAEPVYEAQNKENERQIEWQRERERAYKEELKERDRYSYAEQAPRVDKVTFGSEEPKYMLSMQHDGKRYIFNDGAFQIIYHENGRTVLRAMNPAEVQMFLDSVADAGPQEPDDNYISTFLKAKESVGVDKLD